MILLFDVGNTSIKFGVSDGIKILETYRINTDQFKTPDEYYSIIKRFINFENIDKIAISSVVPKITVILKIMIKKHFSFLPFILEDYSKLKISITVSNKKVPNELGADLLCAASGVLNVNNYLIVDYGTATKYIYVENNDLKGIIISPGVVVSLKGLVDSTALLPEVEVKVPKKVLGTDTISCIQSAITYGTASETDGLVSKIKKEVKTDFKIYVTGGLSKIIAPLLENEVCIDDNLVLKGLLEIYNKNI